MEWLMAQDTRTVVLLAAGAGLVAMALLMWVCRYAWRSVDPPYEPVRRRPRELAPWHVDPVTDRTGFVRDVEPARRSLDPAWREAVVDQPKAPARHRVEHHEETRAWKPADLRRALEDRDRG